MTWGRLLRSILLINGLVGFLAVGVLAQSSAPESKVTIKNPPVASNETLTSNGTSWTYPLKVELQVRNIVCVQPASTRVVMVITGAIQPLGSPERNATHTETATPRNLSFNIPAGDYLQQPYVAEQTSMLEVKINDTEPRKFTLQVRLSAFRDLAAIPNCYGTTEKVPGSHAQETFDLVLNADYAPPQPPPAAGTPGLGSLGSWSPWE